MTENRRELIRIYDISIEADSSFKRNVNTLVNRLINTLVQELSMEATV